MSRNRRTKRTAPEPVFLSDAQIVHDIGPLPAHIVEGLVLDSLHAREQCAREQEIARRMAYMSLVEDFPFLFDLKRDPRDSEYWEQVAATYKQIMDAAREAQLAYLAESAPPISVTRSPLPRWPVAPQRPLGPQPIAAVAWRREPWEAIHPTPLGPLPELLYNDHRADPHEVPLVTPPWARTEWPELGNAIDRGMQLRHDAGLTE